MRWVPQYLWVRDESGLRRVLLSPLLLVEAVYRVGAYLHRKMYDWRLRASVQIPPRVISVGNLTVGGSAKTPVAGWLAAALRARGRKVAVLSRGVRGAGWRAVNVVSDGERVLLAPADVGDEPVLLASALPGVPVLAGRNRVALGLRASAVFGAEVVILDDGFQHHRVRRDLDLVCVDARLGLGNGHVLPRGPLRESRRALQRAHAILWTRVPDTGVPTTPDPRVPPGLPTYRARVVPRRVRLLESGELVPLERLRGESVGLLAAIARPDRLRLSLEELGAKVVAEAAFPDHHLYRRPEIDGLDRRTWWITTSKDAVKLPAPWIQDLRIGVLEEEVQVDEAHRLLDWIVGHLDQPRRV